MSATIATPSIRRERPDNATTVGTATGGGVAATEYGVGPVRQTLLTFTRFPVTTGNTSGASFGSAKIYDFPEGRIGILGSTAYFPTITFNTTAGTNGDIAGAGSGDFSIGSTATADATLSGTDIDMLPSTAMLDPFVTGAGRSNAVGALAASTQLDGTTTPVDAYLNVIIDDADVSDGAASDNVYFTGTVLITWINYGDPATT